MVAHGHCLDKVENIYNRPTLRCSNFIQNTVYQISSESAKFCRRYDEKKMTFESST